MNPNNKGVTLWRDSVSWKVLVAIMPLMGEIKAGYKELGFNEAVSLVCRHLVTEGWHNVPFVEGKVFKKMLQYFGQYNTYPPDYVVASWIRSEYATYETNVEYFTSCKEL